MAWPRTPWRSRPSRACRRRPGCLCWEPPRSPTTRGVVLQDVCSAERAPHHHTGVRRRPDRSMSFAQERHRGHLDTRDWIFARVPEAPHGTEITRRTDACPGSTAGGPPQSCQFAEVNLRAGSSAQGPVSAPRSWRWWGNEPDPCNLSRIRAPARSCVPANCAQSAFHGACRRWVRPWFAAPPRSTRTRDTAGLTGSSAPCSADVPRETQHPSR